MKSGTPRSSLSVTFWGAARAVTGSMHLVEAGGKRILLDCGMVRGGHSEAVASGFPFDPHSVDAVILTHAHIDHCGNLPALVRHGFDGPIFCTAATRDLTAVMLADSARIQEERSVLAFATHRGGAPRDTPFTGSDVDQAVEQCVSVGYEQPTAIGDVEFRLVDAGHLLGSCMVTLATSGGSRPPLATRTLTYTGDLGRRDLPLHGPPAAIPPADLLLCESTYGGRSHDPVPQTTARLAEIIRKTIARSGRVLIPAFSLGRTQLVVFALQTAMDRGEIPQVDIFVDSPLAAEITSVYRRHPLSPRSMTGGKMNTEAETFLGGKHVHYIRDRDESLALAERATPYIVVAASGMCDAGRILHHLKRSVDDPRASVILVSYQAPNTVGNRLMERGPTIQIGRRSFNKWADVHYLNGFSGHADHADFLALLAPLAGQVKKVRLVHGESESATALADGLRGLGFADVAIPGRGETETLA
jgi:metallo-beta-lactamase family protein